MGKPKPAKPVDVSNDIQLKPKDIKSTHERLLPKDTTRVKKVYWSFGFKFFEQVEYFGLNKMETSWFVSVIERLKDTSKMEYTGVTEVLEDGYRYHEINWNAKNIPLQRKDFTWVHKDYLDNELEFPFCQFHVSKGKGRIVGFWDENNVFQILLLDPLHNLQPSSFTSYELRDCFPAKSEYDILHCEIQNISAQSCTDPNCKILDAVKKIPSYANHPNIVLAHLDDSFHAKHIEILQKKTFTEILEAGIFSMIT
ncbi:hypothetical protein [Pedobacter sp.]